MTHATFADAYDATETTPAANDTPIVNKIRAGRVAALTALRAKREEAGNIVALFDAPLPRRKPSPVFHSVRTAAEPKLPPLVLTNPVAA